MGLNCVGPLICGYFPIVNTTVLHNPHLVKSIDVEEPQLLRPTINYM